MVGHEDTRAWQLREVLGALHRRRGLAPYGGPQDAAQERGPDADRERGPRPGGREFARARLGHPGLGRSGHDGPGPPVAPVA